MTKRLINVLAILLIATLILVLNHERIHNNIDVVHDSTTVVVRDTLTDTIRITHTDIKEVDRVIIRTDTIKKDTVLKYEHKHFQDTFKLGSNKALVDVFTSGIDTRLDSVKIDAQIENYHTITTTTITNTITNKKKFKDRLFIAPSVGVGYGFINNKPDVYIGISAGIKL